MKGEDWKQFWVGFWQGFTCWTLPIRWMASSLKIQECQHDWLAGRHPVTKELTTRTCLKGHEKQTYHGGWR